MDGQTTCRGVIALCVASRGNRMTTKMTAYHAYAVADTEVLDGMGEQVERQKREEACAKADNFFYTLHAEKVKFDAQFVTCNVSTTERRPGRFKNKMFCTCKDRTMLHVKRQTPPIEITQISHTHIPIHSLYPWRATHGGYRLTFVVQAANI